MTAHYAHIGLETTQNAVAVLPDVTNVNAGMKHLNPAGTALETVIALLDSLSPGELDAVAKKAEELIKAGKA